MALEIAVDRRELPTTADINLIATVFHGAFWYRLLNGMPLTESFGERLLELVFGVQTQWWIKGLNEAAFAAFGAPGFA